MRRRSATSTSIATRGNGATTTARSVRRRSWSRWSNTRAAGAGLNGDTSAAASSRRLFWQGFLVAATNPKVLFFYAAFFPQFVDPAAAALPQLLLLSTTFLIIAAVIDSGYALVGGRSRGWLANRARARLTDRITGTLLIGTGLWLAFARRGAGG